MQVDPAILSTKSTLWLERKWMNTNIYAGS